MSYPEKLEVGDRVMFCTGKEAVIIKSMPQTVRAQLEGKGWGDAFYLDRFYLNRYWAPFVPSKKVAPGIALRIRELQAHQDALQAQITGYRDEQTALYEQAIKDAGWQMLR